ncbi:hypothetical protein PC110_g11476 [Phytophthora cactorum]|uniref:Elicitin n=1 Tax=Phytophthora cactorum TaxID=29920 RepID=A0A329S8D6_9STRA|nr:hypothetical protein PC110_g11476 [Phytophthora cactorum]
MRCWTFGAALAMLVFGSADALDNCDSNVLVKAYEGLNVNAQLVSCMTQNNFSAALDGSVDLTTVNAATAPEQVKSICAADSCKTILTTATPTTTTAPSLDDPTQQQQQTTFSVLSSDSGSAAGVTPGKYCK